jgi:nucleoside-diphosphate-sugar epimerase
MANPTALIGHTGFIGGNLAKQFSFNECFDSKNIGDIRGKEFDLLVCAGVTAVKWWANLHPAEDKARIDELLSDLASVRAKRVVVLSTVDVYPLGKAVDESFDCHSLPNHAYGTHRLYFEGALQKQFAEVTVVRISGVVGPGLKKNVIYDLLHNNCLNAINPESSFQYYNVSHLWRDLEQLDQSGIHLINFVTEPIRTQDIVDCFFPGKRLGDNPAPKAHYDIHTLYSSQFDGPRHYMASASDVMLELGSFVTAFDSACKHEAFGL